jgi:hypothetical protein
MPEAVFRFAEALRTLLDAESPGYLEAHWEHLDVEAVGWAAVGLARRRDVPRWEPVLGEVDWLLLRLIDLVRRSASGSQPEEIHLRTFRLPALERLQHATAAALVAQRFGHAGLRVVVSDDSAPLARRYFAFLALAERHSPLDWPLFQRYLRPGAHHAFLGTAVEAIRFYPDNDAVQHLMRLFQAVRGDPHLRAFLSPRILGSLDVLADPRSLPFLRELLTVGHTAPDPEHCEVTRALVTVRRLTGRIERNSKFGGLTEAEVRAALDRAESLFDSRREVFVPVEVI